LSDVAEDLFKQYEEENRPVIALSSDALKSAAFHPAWLHLCVIHRAIVKTVGGVEQRKRDSSTKQLGFVCVHCGTTFGVESSTAKRHLSQSID
jgi:hypothetical protein